MKGLRTASIFSAFSAIFFSAMLANAQPETPSQNLPARLDGTSWQLVRFQGGDDKTLIPDDKSKYTVVFNADGGVNVRIDCNRGHGTWKSSGPNQIEFGPLGLTRMMCPPAPLNERLAKDWQYVRSYIFKDGHLFLSLMADSGIYEFEPTSQEGGSDMSGSTASSSSTTARVEGTATYRERMALPSNAVFEATMEDISKADARAEIIGRTRIEQPGNPPIHFEIPYDPSLRDPQHRYAVRARILAGGETLFVSDQAHPVSNAGTGDRIEIMLRRYGTTSAAQEKATTPMVPATATTPATLENTYWKLTHLPGGEITAASGKQEPHIILNSETHRVSGAGGCNRLTGGYQVDGDKITFTQMVSTMMACIEGMDTEKLFLNAMKNVNSWKITGQQLNLFDTPGTLLASFESRYMK